MYQHIIRAIQDVPPPSHITHPVLADAARLAWEAARLHVCLTALLHISAGVSLDIARITRVWERTFARMQRRERAQQAAWRRVYPMEEDGHAES